MPSPLQFGDPPQLGPFRLTERIEEGQAGIVYLGVDPQGTQAAVAVLHQGAAADPAARDRFRAAIVDGDGLAWIAPQVLAAEPDGPAPWVATHYAPGDPGAGVFLTPVAMAGNTPPPPLQPQFQHHWAGGNEPAVPVPQWGSGPAMPAAGAAAGRSGPRASLVAGLVALGVLVVVLVVLVVALVNNTGGDPVAKPRPTGAPTTDVPSPTATPSTSPSRSNPSPLATAVPTGRPPYSHAKVKGPTWRRGDNTYLMKLHKIGVLFRTPDGWGCMRSSSATPPNIRWNCVDESGKRKGTSVTVEVRPCPNGCSRAARLKARTGVNPKGNWKRSDRSTSYAEWTDSGDYQIMTLHFWHQANTTKGLNAQVIALGSAKPGDKPEVLKMINDIRANTP